MIPTHRSMVLAPAVAAWLVLAACSRTPEPPAAAAAAAPAGEPYLNHAADVAYVGRDACRSCHRDIDTTTRHTGMGRSWYPMTPAVAVEDFSGRGVVTDGKSGTRYRMVEREGRYFQRQFVQGASGQELVVDEREMQEVVGSNNHSRLYGTWVGDRLYQMPVAWYPLKGIWDLAPGYQHFNLFFTREITEECAFCHNARMPALPGERNVYQRPLPDGIDCERCHGPGARHIERWAAGPAAQPGEVDRTIVNPRRLPLPLRLQVCYQCHLGGSETAERIERDDRDLWNFRPGQPLLEVMVPFGYAQALEGQYNVTGQVDRMILSRCFTESGGQLECLTCHNPHLTIYREDRPADYFRQRCLSCHVTEDCDASGASRAATRPPDDCVACHMRRAEPTDHPHTVFIDHWIRRRPEALSPASRTDFTFTPILPETKSLLSPGEFEYYRGRSSFLKAYQSLEPTHQSELRRNAEATLKRATELGFDTADVWFYRGKNLSAMQRWDAAAEALRQALQRDPKHRDASFEYATSLMRLGRFAEAGAVFRPLIERDADDEAVLADLGVCEMSLGRPAEALALLDRAIARDPLRGSLHANRGLSLAQLGRTMDAREAFERAVALEPANAAVWETHASLLQQVGEDRRATELRQHAERLRAGTRP